MHQHREKAATFPPRGSGEAGKRETLPGQTWQNPVMLDERWDWKRGKLLLGASANRLIGDPDRTLPRPMPGDDRHIVTVAGSRAGKSSTVLIPNLRRYPGSVLVIDPKGELARATAYFRQQEFGQHVAVLDPFNTCEWKSQSYNPLDELNPAAPTFIDDIALVADALIVDTNASDKHWTDAAKNFIRGCLLYIYATGEATLPRLRRITLGDEGLISIPEGNPDNRDDFLLLRMADMEAFNGLVSLIAHTMLDKSDKEFNSVLSVAREQISFLDSVPLSGCLQSSSFRLNKIKSQPTTIYLCLPATRLATHAKWLRVVLSMVLIEMERDQTKPEHPVLLMLEEFAALGYLRSIEFASGFMAAFGVRLWPVLQDLSQLRANYPNSWETFLGNAGVLQAFGNIDHETTEYISKRIGNTVVREKQDVFTTASQRSQGDPGYRENLRLTRLIEASEITQHFARETNRQIILTPGSNPIYAFRLPPE